MELNFSKLITESGVPLWVLNLPHSRTVAAGVLVRSGTRNEVWPKEAGIAHALEHMHFQGTEGFPSGQKITEYIEETGGRINAWTHKEMTFHYIKVPAIYSERAVHILSEQLKKSIIPEEKIPIEMKNVVQEIHRKNDNPQRFILTTSDQFVYKNHPLSRDTLGLEESVLSFTKNDFLSFKNRCYDPSNYVFIVAGKITEQEALELFNKYFPEKPKIKQNIFTPQTIEINNNRQFVKKRDIEQVHLVLSATTCMAKDKDALYLDFFTDMISGGMSFPLFQDVRDKLGLCYEIWADHTKWSDVGKFDIYIGTDSLRYKEAIKASLAVIEKYKKDESLLEKVKKLKIGQLSIWYEDTARIIDMAAQDIAFTDEPKGYNQILKEIKEVDIKNINDVVEKYLKPDLIYTSILAPNYFDLK
ncbi:MAG: pitrilysin family protein [Candidatus Paceibacterota bacterium]